jgi:hypothetical protein
MLRLQDQDLEHRHRIKRWPPAFAAVAITQPLDKPVPEILEINRPLQNFKRITMRAQRFKVIVQAEKRWGAIGRLRARDLISESQQN